MDPKVHYGRSEAISLAFITALQLLRPWQRAVLVLHDVVGYCASDVADMLDATQESIQTALNQARTTVDTYLGDSRNSLPLHRPDSTAENQLMAQLTNAFERADLQGLIGLLTKDVRLSMPSAMLEHRGIGPARGFFASVAFRPGRSVRVVPTRANGQPAFGMYIADPHTDIFRAYGLLVFTVDDNRISAVTCFDTTVMSRFGLPRRLPEGDA
jgi:RNA polymerase sigma-70 factor (ECF subfamily)